MRLRKLDEQWASHEPKPVRNLGDSSLRNNREKVSSTSTHFVVREHVAHSSMSRRGIWRDEEQRWQMGTLHPVGPTLNAIQRGREQWVSWSAGMCSVCSLFGYYWLARSHQSMLLTSATCSAEGFHGACWTAAVSKCFSWDATEHQNTNQPAGPLLENW